MPKRKKQTLEKEPLKGNSKYYSIILAVILALFLLSSSIYYLISSEGFRRGALIGDGICGNFATEETQDECCSDLHENDSHIECVGGWEYISGMSQCQYVCLDGLPGCQEDAKICPNGRTVVRDPNNDCKFEPC